MKQNKSLRPSLTSISSFLSFYAESKGKQQVFCVQVGANDGKNNDPVYPFITGKNWKGLLIEPQTDVFEQGLTKTYAGNQNVILENVALAPTSGYLPFYRIAVSKSRWATGLSSFDRKSLEEHISTGYAVRKAKEEGVEIPSDLSKMIETVQVPTMTVDQLFQKHHIDRFQILCVDTEGFDYEILKLFDFKKYTPEVVLFESKNLSNEDFASAQKILKDAGYSLFWEKGDTLAVKYQYPFIMQTSHKLKAFLKKI